MSLKRQYLLLKLYVYFIKIKLYGDMCEAIIFILFTESIHVWQCSFLTQNVSVS